MVAPEVPFLGAVKLATIGRRVAIYKRVLSRAGFYPWLPVFTPFAGPTFVRAVNRFQQANGQPANAVLGEKTHELLCAAHRKDHPGEWAFDATAIDEMRVLLASELTQKTLSFARWLIAHQQLVGYSEARPWPDPPPPPNTSSFDIDCSGSVKLLRHWSDGLDLDDQGVGFGNTATLAAHGLHVSDLDHAQPLDLCIYGSLTEAGPGAHVTMLMEKRAGIWYAFSHGEPSDPREIQADYRQILGIRRYPIRV